MCHHILQNDISAFWEVDFGEKNIIIWGKTCCDWGNQMSSWLPTSIELLRRTEQKLEKGALDFSPHSGPTLQPSEIYSVHDVVPYLHKRPHKIQLPPAQRKIHSELQQKLWKRITLSSTQNNATHSMASKNKTM